MQKIRHSFAEFGHHLALYIVENAMNMRSSMKRRDRTGNLDHLTDMTATATLRPALRGHKRWQPRQRRTESTVRRKPAFSEVTRSDEDILLRQQALTEAQQGNYTKAVLLFSQLIERSPDNAQDYNNRGLVYFQSGQMEKAIADYNKALELNPCLDSVYNNRANYYAARGQLLEAILDYDIAIDLNPSNIRAWINQGITFRDLQMYERAIESFDLALCFGRLEGYIYAQRGRTYHIWGDWNCAMADYNRAIDYLPISDNLTNDPASRLRFQVEIWVDELITQAEF
jgi:tetratricopeptide (TPR) repeat protein